MEKAEQRIPAVALRGMTILPEMITHFDVSRSRSVKAVEQALKQGQRLFIVTQKSPETENPAREDLFVMGTVAEVKQIVKMPHNILRVLVEGLERAKLVSLEEGDYLEADVAGAGQIFAETYACVPGERLMVNVRAAEPVRVLFLDVGKVLHVCSGACSCHNKLIRNLLSISAQKNLNLSRRILHTSSKTIRGRILSYLSYQSMRAGSREFQIPFNRQQLADYLGVDRSAMSSELGKMQKEGILRTERNYFCLLEQKDEYS